MSTPRNNFLNTDEPVLKALLDEMISNMLCVNKGYFSYRIEVGKSDLMVEFKYDEMSNITFTPKSTVREIAQDADCFQVIDLSKGSVELVDWQYDGDSEY